MWNPFKRAKAVESSEGKRSKSPSRRDHVRFAVAQNKSFGPRLMGQGLSADSVLRRDVESVRAASRTAGEDDSYIKRYFGMVQTHVVGDEGFRFQSKVKDTAGELDKAVNDIIEAAFKEWSKQGICEISGCMSLVAAEELIAKTVSQDGDILIRHIYGGHNTFGYSFQLIEADLLDISLYKDLPNGNRIRMGVEVDGFDRRVAYHVLTNHPGDHTWTNKGRRYVRIPAEEITLPFPMWRPGQKRGVPWAHAALLEAHSVSGLKESELTRSRIAANNMVVYERDPELEPPETDDDDGWDLDGEFIEELEAGTASIVPEGYRTRETNFTPPNTSLPDQVKTGLKGAGAGLEVSYPVLGNDYEAVNFSSLRQAVLEDRDHWKRKQRWFRESVLEPIYANWLKAALLNGALSGLGPWDFTRLNQPQFSGRRWSWVDPYKDEQAIGAGMDNFTVNPMKVLADKGLELQETAEGWNQFLDVMGDVMGRARELGFGRGKPQPPAAGAQEQPDDEQE
jgi:lambda family phage portal protein